MTKPYRYTGMERDEETGLSYHNARYYIPWLCRWLNPDPIGIGDGVNVYSYCRNNPVGNIDVEGTQTTDDQNNAQKAYEEGEKTTQAGFQKSLDEIAGSKADPGFKEWMGDIGLSGVVDFRNQLFESKLAAYSDGLAKLAYGTNSDGSVKIPEWIRQREWTAANAEAIPTLKASWAALKSEFDPSSFKDTVNPLKQASFLYFSALTVSNKEEGLKLLKSVGLQVGVAWALHLMGGGFSNLSKTTTALVEKNAAMRLANFESGIPSAHFVSRHGAQTTLKQQLERATTGLTPDGVAGRAVDASRFLSNRFQLNAVRQAEAIYNETGQTSFTFNMGKPIGEGYIKGGGSVVNTSNVQAVFRNGKLYTMYPKLR